MPAKSTPGKAIAIFVFGFPYFVFRGALAFLRGFARFRRAVRGLRLGLAKELHCPNGHPNAVIGRWDCASCKGVYIGWVGRCSVCGAGAAWFPCATCGVSVLLPWEAVR